MTSYRDNSDGGSERGRRKRKPDSNASGRGGGGKEKTNEIKIALPSLMGLIYRRPSWREASRKPEQVSGDLDQR